MDCPFYRTFFQYVIERDRNAHRFTLANALKDVSYLAGFAQALGVANPVGAAVRNSFAQAVATGHGDDYVPMLSDLVAEWNGTSLAPHGGRVSRPRGGLRLAPQAFSAALAPRSARGRARRAGNSRARSGPPERGGLRGCG